MVLTITASGVVLVSVSGVGSALVVGCRVGAGLVPGWCRVLGVVNIGVLTTYDMLIYNGVTV